MNNRLNKHGFTLVELLVAVALISAILCMVYGSYFATSKSAQTCKAMITVSQQGRKTLEQMARQIRCSYAGTDADYTEAEPIETGSMQTEMIVEDSISYFNGNSLAPRGEILHLVTTNRLIGEKQPADGLFEVTYKFDKRASLLSLSQREFIGSAQKTGERNWQPVAEGVKSMELTFFDGKKWLRSWDFKDKKKLPCAVRIEMSCEDEDRRLYHYATVAYVSCRKNGERIRTEKLVLVNK
jgi:prepilin-type N-terminal cleavage/methylation domain-containing protein